VGLSFKSLASMGELHWRVVKAALTMGLIGEGAGKDKLGQPRRWESVEWTISCHPSFFKTSGCNEM
jgi:hypothetical protein